MACEHNAKLFYHDQLRVTRDLKSKELKVMRSHMRKQLQNDNVDAEKVSNQILIAMYNVFVTMCNVGNNVQRFRHKILKPHHRYVVIQGLLCSSLFSRFLSFL